MASRWRWDVIPEVVGRTWTTVSGSKQKAAVAQTGGESEITRKHDSCVFYKSLF